MKEHITLCHEDLKAVNTEENPDEVTPRADGVSKVEGGVLTAVLKSKSWNVIRLAKPDSRGQ